MFKRKRILKDTADIMRDSNILEKTFNALKLSTDLNYRKKAIINQFEQRRDYNTKSTILMSLH
jgi:hypothetical protein